MRVLRGAVPRRCGRGDRGAVAVEAALVVPLLVTLLFGIVEFAFVMRDDVAVASSARAGARIASANAGGGPGTCAVGVTPCSPANTPALAQKAAEAIRTAGSAMPLDQIQYVLIYKANSDGYPGAEGNTSITPTCPANCVKYVWRASTDEFVYNSGTWVSTTIDACPGETDTFGVFLAAKHSTLTGIIPSISVSDRTVMKFEPLTIESCKPGTASPHP